MQQLGVQVPRQPPRVKPKVSARRGGAAFYPSIDINSIAAFLDLALDRLEHGLKKTRTRSV